MILFFLHVQPFEKRGRFDRPRSWFSRQFPRYDLISKCWRITARIVFRERPRSVSTSLSLSLFQCSRGAFSLLPSKSPRLFPLCFHDVKFLECHPNCNKVFFGVLLHRPLLPSTTAASATISTTFSSSPSSTSSVAFSLLVHARLEGVTMPRSGPPRRGTVVTISNEMKY